jgi:hypothetical protein
MTFPSTENARPKGYNAVRERELKMPAKNVANREKAEKDRPEQSPPETGRYLLQIDRQSKRSFKTPEAAQTAAREIKSRFPALHISIYDTVTGSRTVVDSSDSGS